MIKINVLREGRREKKKGKPLITTEASEKQATYIFLGVLGVVGLVIGLLWWSQSSRISKIQGEIRRLESEKSKYRDVIKQLEEAARKEQILKEKIKLIEKIKKTRIIAVKILDELSKNLPEQVWYTSLEYKGNTVKLNGYSFSNELIADLISNLEKTDVFSNVNLIKSSKVKKSEYDIYSFSLKMDVNTTKKEQKKK